MRLRSFLLTSALTFAPVVASATTISGLYVDGGAGYNLVQDQHVHANSPANGDALPKFSVNHGTGFTGFGAVGWGFGNGLRVEAEGLYNFSHDNYDSWSRGSGSEVLSPYKNKSLVKVIPWTGAGFDGLKKYMGGYVTGPYDLTVQKVSEAPEWLTNPNFLLSSNAYMNSHNLYTGYAGPVSNGGNYGFSARPPGGDYDIPDFTNATSKMIGCSDCYFVNVFTPQQAQELENGENNIVNGAETSPWIYAWTFPRYMDQDVITMIQDGKLPKGIYYIGQTAEVSQSGSVNPIVCNDGKCIYNQDTAAALGSSKSFSLQSFYVNTRDMQQQALVSHHNTDESWGGFANVLYDFDLERLFGIKSIVTPFIGGGAGYLWQRYNRPNTMIAAITGTHGGFSWQGIAGVAFDTGIAGLQVVAQYRMIGQPGSFYNGTFNYGTEGGHANFDQRFNHQFIVGFRYAFHNQPVPIQAPPVPRPIVAAAPAPVPARSYLVFFDWNQYALTSRARQIVVEAAHATSYVHTTRINVNGYTDSSAAPGPAGQKYNYALSVKRARSVEAELIRNGVPASEIVIRGYGDTNPLVPTGPNTREPQNRRVEIILHA